jgi:hypothetical protein
VSLKRLQGQQLKIVGLYKSTGGARQFYLSKKPLKMTVRHSVFVAILNLCRGIYRHNPTTGMALIVEPGAMPVVQVKCFTSACEAE